MYERLADRSRRVLQFAQQYAKELNHEYVGVEHVLYGLAKEGSSVAANCLKNLGADYKAVSGALAKFVKPGPDFVNLGVLPFTPRARKVIDGAIGCAEQLDHNYVGTEHLLISLCGDTEGLGAKVLKDLGLDPHKVAQEMIDLLGGANISTSASEFSAMRQIAEIIDNATKNERRIILAWLTSKYFTIEETETAWTVSIPAELVGKPKEVKPPDKSRTPKWPDSQGDWLLWLLKPDGEEECRQVMVWMECGRMVGRFVGSAEPPKVVEVFPDGIWQKMAVNEKNRASAEGTIVETPTRG